MKADYLLSAMGSIEDDLILEAKEETKMKKTDTGRVARRLLLVAALIGILGITAVGAYFMVDWDEIFVDRFTPTEEIASQLEGALDSPMVTVSRDGATLSVRQTMTDGSVMWAVVELELPEDFDMELLRVDSQGLEADTLRLFATQDETTGNWYTGPGTIWAQWFQGELPEEELESLTAETMEEKYAFAENLIKLGGGSFLSKNVDAASKTVTYLLMMDYDGEKAGPVTIWFENIYCGDDGEDPQLSGPIYLSWTPQYTVDTCSLELEKEGATVGTVEITPLSVKVNVPNLLDVMEEPPEVGSEAYETLVDRVLHETGYFEGLVPITIRFADGTEYTLEQGKGGGWDMASEGLTLTAEEIFWRELLDVNQVASVTVGAITVEP